MIGVFLESYIVKTIILAFFELLFVFSFTAGNMAEEGVLGHKVGFVEWAIQQLSFVLFTILLHY
jgi:hypothetical protein